MLRLRLWSSESVFVHPSTVHVHRLLLSVFNVPEDEFFEYFGFLTFLFVRSRPDLDSRLAEEEGSPQDETGTVQVVRRSGVSALNIPGPAGRSGNAREKGSMLLACSWMRASCRARSPLDTEEVGELELEQVDCELPVDEDESGLGMGMGLKSELKSDGWKIGSVTEKRLGSRNCWNAFSESDVFGSAVNVPLKASPRQDVPSICDGGRKENASI